jgi:hypothetical protein
MNELDYRAKWQKSKTSAAIWLQRSTIRGLVLHLNTGQPINADSAACGVAPKLDELLD